MNGRFSPMNDHRDARIAISRFALCALTITLASAGAFAASHYTDLRNIRPIHGDAAAGAKKATVCFACHGANGTSIAPTFPRLAGQRIDYLYHRLSSFKGASAKDPYYSKSPMTAMAAPLSDTDMRDLAAFFASQPPQAAPSASATAALDKGERLYRSGDPGKGIPACQGCHGAEARGPALATGPYAVYPLLRAQYPLYVVARLTSFRSDLPHDTTSDFIMSNVAHSLDDDSIQAVAAWLGSLAPEKSL
jgi:cytochrome c553